MFCDFSCFACRFEFEGEGEEDLSFKEGDVIILKNRVGEWLRGELRGKSGIFPLAFVEIIEDLATEPPSVNGDLRHSLPSSADEQISPSGAEAPKVDLPVAHFCQPFDILYLLLL